MVRYFNSWLIRAGRWTTGARGKSFTPPTSMPRLAARTTKLSVPWGPRVQPSRAQAARTPLARFRRFSGAIGLASARRRNVRDAEGRPGYHAGNGATLDADHPLRLPRSLGLELRVEGQLPLG